MGCSDPTAPARRPRSKFWKACGHAPAGEVKVLDFDPDRQKTQLKDRIGACLQATNLPDKITVREALDFFGSLYSRKADAGTLLKRLQLWDKKDAGYATLSGGQKQRLALALALINDPQMLFLDEPTTGLDPQVRLEIRDLIEELRADKRTILMTTHYIEEAERLCDRVAIIDAGQIIAIGTPRELQERSANQSTSSEIRLKPAVEGNRFAAVAGIDSAASSATIGIEITVYSRRPARTLVEMVKWIEQQGFELDDVHLSSSDARRCFH